MGRQAQNGGLARHFFGLLHGRLFDDQRNDAGAAQLVPRFYGNARRPGGDHHAAQAVHGVQALGIGQKQPVALGNQLDLPLLGGRGAHELVLADLAQHFCRIVFVQHVLVVFPHINMVFPHAEQHGDIFFFDDMALAEHGVLGDALEDLM